MNDIIAVHKQIERTLRRLTVIAEHAREGIVVLDLNGVVQFVNSAWAVMHGYETTTDLIGRQVSTFHSKEQIKTDVITFIEEAKHRGQFAGRLGHVRKDGTPFLTEMLMVVFNNDADEAVGIVAFAADITEQERTKDELKQHRCQLDELVRQQTETLETANAQLQRRADENEQTARKLRQQIDELSAANEQLREQIREHERAKDKLEQQYGKLEQRLSRRNNKLMALRAQLQDEITRRQKQAEYFRQQTDAIKAAGERLQAKIDELNTAGSVDESDEPKATDSVKATASFIDDEKTMLENVFRQNIVLQKPKLDSAAEKDA